MPQLSRPWGLTLADPFPNDFSAKRKQAPTGRAFYPHGGIYMRIGITPTNDLAKHAGSGPRPV